MLQNKACSFDFTLTKWKKEDTSISLFLAEYHNNRQKYKDCILNFTDGSKTVSGTGFRIVIQESANSTIIKNSLLPAYASVYSVAAEGILTACTQAALSKKQPPYLVIHCHPIGH